MFVSTLNLTKTSAARRFCCSIFNFIWSSASCRFMSARRTSMPARRASTPWSRARRSPATARMLDICIAPYNSNAHEHVQHLIRVSGQYTAYSLYTHQSLTLVFQFLNLVRVVIETQQLSLVHRRELLIAGGLNSEKKNSIYR